MEDQKGIKETLEALPMLGRHDEPTLVRYQSFRSRAGALKKEKGLCFSVKKNPLGGFYAQRISCDKKVGMTKKLLSLNLDEGEIFSIDKYNSVHTTASRLEKEGRGSWNVSKNKLRVTAVRTS